MEKTFREIMENWIPTDDEELKLVAPEELELLDDFVTFMDNSYYKAKEMPNDVKEQHFLGDK